MLAKDKTVFTFSMHCESNFPLIKMKSDIDVEIINNIKDEEYLDLLSFNLNKLEKLNTDIIFFQAGVDTLFEDKLGKLSLTRKGLCARNKMVMDFAKKKNCPIVVFMGGG